MQVEIDVSRRSRGSAATTNESLVAGAVRDPRVHEERLRRPRHRRNRQAAGRLQAEPARVGRHWSLGHSARAVPRVWRSSRRHPPRDRQHTRAHQHAGGADVGAWYGTADDDRAIRPAARNVVERCDAAHARHRRLLVQRAESPVPDGQPGRVQPVLIADLHRPRREPHAGLPSGGASHGHGRRARRPHARRPGHRPGSQAGVP